MTTIDEPLGAATGMFAPGSAAGTAKTAIAEAQGTSGRRSPTPARMAFPDLDAARSGDDSVLTGVLLDQAALCRVFAQLEALGIALIDVARGPCPKERDR